MDGTAVADGGKLCASIRQRNQSNRSSFSITMELIHPTISRLSTIDDESYQSQIQRGASGSNSFFC